MQTIENENTILLPTNLKEGQNPEEAVAQSVDPIFKDIEAQYSNDYEVSISDADSTDDEWSKSIKIRNGLKIGAELEAKLIKEAPEFYKLSISESSKLGMILLIGIIGLFAILGIHCATNEISYFEVLPGSGKFAAVLGGLIMLIPGAITYAIVSKLVMGKDKEESKKLINKIFTKLKTDLEL